MDRTSRFAPALDLSLLAGAALALINFAALPMWKPLLRVAFPSTLIFLAAPGLILAFVAVALLLAPRKTTPNPSVRSGSYAAQRYIWDWRDIER